MSCPSPSRLLGACMPAAATLAPDPARTGFPPGPVRVAVPCPAGSGPDAVVHRADERPARERSRPVVIDHRPGAGGRLSIVDAARAPADGCTTLPTVAPAGARHDAGGVGRNIASLVRGTRP